MTENSNCSILALQRTLMFGLVQLSARQGRPGCSSTCISWMQAPSSPEIADKCGVVGSSASLVETNYFVLAGNVFCFAATLFLVVLNWSEVLADSYIITV